MARQPGTYATLQTSEGTIVCRLFDNDAPKTVANFTDLAEGKRDWTHPVSGKKSKDRLYDGTIFHRVIPDFMIQGGDPAGNGMGGPGYQFEDETRNSPHKFDKKGKLVIHPGELQTDRVLTVQQASRSGGNALPKTGDPSKSAGADEKKSKGTQNRPDTKLEDLFKLTRDEFDGFQYAHAWSFVYFLNNFENGKYQKAFNKFFNIRKGK
jgi:peptidyl-prolyl cis-trans isomerase A (cyclophilin A)